MPSINPFHLPEDPPFVHGQDGFIFPNLLKHCPAVKLITGLFEVVSVAKRIKTWVKKATQINQKVKRQRMLCRFFCNHDVSRFSLLRMLLQEHLWGARVWWLESIPGVGWKELGCECSSGVTTAAPVSRLHTLAVVSPAIRKIRKHGDFWSNISFKNK